MLTRKKTKPKSRPRCGVCGERLDSKRHRGITESYCFILNEKKLRTAARPKVQKISDCYADNNRLRPELQGTDMEGKLMARQQRLALDAVLGLSSNGYKVPRNVTHFADAGFVWTQINVRRPWAVYVLVNGKRKRKRFNNLWDAVTFHRRVSKRYSAGIVSLGHAYDLPRQYREKIAKLPKRFKWCPHCAEFRVFRRRHPIETFVTLVKHWSDEKQRFVWSERTLVVTECQLCSNSNRSPVFRRSNQPWEVRKIKPRKRRVKPRVRTRVVGKERRIVKPSK